ncbi:hypothetical protein AVEN_30025-1 [Araneus ventricosus]|uniref:Uncharacterized protein n=1 Tax=Araneus ventricosus TaxID=182803 RepID=A0A4Y2DYT0_ARAVE|nr:hypothetical protein AVEN_30025-1 [Araneus ventricosus]
MTSWLKGFRHMPFALPMVWREPKNHSTDCYFCLTDISGLTSHSRHTVVYPNLPSAIRPVTHSSELSIPKPTETWSLDDNDDIVPNSVVVKEAEDDQVPMYADVQTSPMPHLISRSDLNDLVRDLNLSKNQSELLASRLKEWNLLEKETKVCSFRKRQQDFQDFFSRDGDVIFCNDVDSLFKALGLQHKPQEWRLFIDSSNVSLKAVLLHNVGLQAGYTKFCCFLCQWNSRDRKNHYIKKVWPKRQFLITCVKNVENEPLVASEKIILPPLHIKLGLMKNFVKAMDCGRRGFQYLCLNFLKVSEAKIKEGIFVGPQIRQLMKDPVFESKLTEKEAAAWTSEGVSKKLPWKSQS